MPDSVVTLRLRVKDHAKVMLETLARAACYKTGSGRLDLGRVVEDLLESALQGAVWVKGQRGEGDYANLQEAVEDHQHVARIAAKRNASIRRRRRREAMRSIKRIKP